MASTTDFEPLFGPEYSLSSGKVGPIWGRGTVLKDGDPWPVGEMISKDVSPEKAAEIASGLNGFFSFAFRAGRQVVAVVDRVRSFPLFYAIHNGTLYLGDDAYRIQEKLGGRQTDPLALAEFYLTGRVARDSTLDPRIRQVMAGEIVTIDVGESKAWVVSRKSYYHFQYQRDKHHLSFEEAISQGQKKMEEAVERMIRVAAGSMIAVPLSGGHDSRFILLALKRLGYPHVVTFSYGVLGNEDAAVSKRVAEALGVPWHFVVYTPELWRKWLDSPEFARYQKSAEQMVSVAHVQDWPAVWELKKKGVFPEGTLFCPGHGGDFLAGKQLRPALLQKSGWNKSSVTREVWKRHYCNVSLRVALRESGAGADAEEVLRQRTEAHFEGFDVESLEGANNAFDAEFWQERLSKFIVNSVRVYEFFGYRWWLPFCDKHLVAFWERVPLEWRVGKMLYDKTIEKMQESYRLEKHTKLKPGAIRRLRHRISFPLLELLIWRAYGRKKMLNNYMLGVQKAFSQRDVMRYLGDRGDVNGCLAAMHHRAYSGEIAATSRD